MKGTVHAREGRWKDAREMVMKYKAKGDKSAQDLVGSLFVGHRLLAGS